MKHSVAVKFIAIILCAVSLVAVAGSVLGVAVGLELGLYSNTPDAWKANQAYSVGHTLAYNAVQLYTAEELGGCSRKVLNALHENMTTYYGGIQVPDDIWSATIMADGEILLPGDAGLKDATVLNFSFSNVWYPKEVGDVVAAKADYSAGEPGWSEYIVVEDGYNQMSTVYLEYYEDTRDYEVTLYFQTSKLVTPYDDIVDLIYEMRNAFIVLALVGLAVFAVCLVYLCCAAGKKPGSSEIAPVGLNRLPLDIYAVCAFVGIFVLFLPVVFLIERMRYDYDVVQNSMWILLAVCALCAFAIALLAIGFIYALAAQAKMKDGYWWRHSVCGWFLQKIGGCLRWIGRGFGYVARGIRAVFRLLPVIWQWLLTAAVMVFVLFITFLITFGSSYFRYSGFFLFLLFMEVLACIAIICYGGWCFGTLMKGAKAMAQGDLNQKINTKYLMGAFKDFAVQLNSLAGAAQIAAERQMKSERMKTELITNVSHDIKTPLTSIINYVDLLKKPHNEAEGELYLEVLDRQSQRLKKLIDDLMEMSKASTGNLSVDIGQVDAVEAVNQALGEFSDKLSTVNLTPVFRYPDFPVTMLADGRLVWRVLSNLLSNAVKYALPDTRLYIDLMVLQGNAVIAIKNISRDQLNMGADELMERFVRGDSSRNTEGSGLGLNIAKSLVELQHGQMHLMVDGDLFKVTLIFPCA